MFGLGHIDLGPVIYGVVIFIGLLSMWNKLMDGKIISLIAEASVFILVFKLHGGTMVGGFAATVAALLSGMFFSWTFREK